MNNLWRRQPSRRIEAGNLFKRFPVAGSEVIAQGFWESSGGVVYQTASDTVTSVDAPILGKTLAYGDSIVGADTSYRNKALVDVDVVVGADACDFGKAFVGVDTVVSSDASLLGKVLSEFDGLVCVDLGLTYKDALATDACYSADLGNCSKIAFVDDCISVFDESIRDMEILIFDSACGVDSYTDGSTQVAAEDALMGYEDYILEKSGEATICLYPQVRNVLFDG